MILKTVTQKIMPKKVAPLTDSKIKATIKAYKSKLTNESKDLRLSDGDGLNLIFKKSGSMSLKTSRLMS